MNVEEFSLGEGNTPLIKAVRIPFLFLSNIELYFKNEGRNPNGTFVDRAAYSLFKRALQRGSEGVLAYSTGTFATSLASYSSRAGIRCVIFVSEEEYKYENFLQALTFDIKLIVVKDGKEKIVEIINRLYKEFPLMSIMSSFDNEINDSVLELFEETEQKIGKADYYFIASNDIQKALAYLSVLKRRHIIGITSDSEITADNIICVTPVEIEEGNILLSKQEGIIPTKNASMGIAGVVKNDRMGKFKDGDKVVLIFDSVESKALYLKPENKDIFTVECDYEVIKDILGLKSIDEY